MFHIQTQLTQVSDILLENVATAIKNSDIVTEREINQCLFQVKGTCVTWSL